MLRGELCPLPTPHTHHMHKCISSPHSAPSLHGETLRLTAAQAALPFRKDHPTLPDSPRAWSCGTSQSVGSPQLTERLDCLPLKPTAPRQLGTFIRRISSWPSEHCCSYDRLAFPCKQGRDAQGRVHQPQPLLHPILPQDITHFHRGARAGLRGGNPEMREPRGAKAGTWKGKGLPALHLLPLHQSAWMPRGSIKTEERPELEQHQAFNCTNSPQTNR